MEWVETTAETIELAKNLALDQLGVAEDDAEFEVVEEPKQGLFGRTRGEARVRARVRPNSVRNKSDRRDKSAKRGPRKDGEAKERNHRSKCPICEQASNSSKRRNFFGEAINSSGKKSKQRNPA